MIKISVVTITYNAADVLKRTLDSVLNQTYQHIRQNGSIPIHEFMKPASLFNNVIARAHI